MKSKFLHYAFIAMCAVFAFTACSEDDDNGSSIAQKVVGEYTGELYVMGVSSTQDIILSKAGDSRVKIVLKDFSFGDMNMGDISAVCDVFEEDGEYLLSGTTDVEIMEGMLTVPVSISGDVYGRELELYLEINLESIGQDSITVSFSGERPIDIDNSEESDTASNVARPDYPAITPSQVVGEWKATHLNGMKFPSYVNITMNIGADGTFWEHTDIPTEDAEEDTEDEIIAGTWSLAGNKLYVETTTLGYYLYIVSLGDDTMQTMVEGDETFTWERK